MKLRTILLVTLSAALLCCVSCNKDKKGFSGTSMDLGVSIKWATMNAGAAKSGEVGTKMTAADALTYVLEGKKWKLPTEEQWKELLTTCTLAFSETADGKGYLVIAAAGAPDIFIPAAIYLCKPDETGADPAIHYVDLTGATPKYGSTESTADLYAIRLVRK